MTMLKDRPQVEVCWERLEERQLLVCKAVIIRDAETDTYTALAVRLPGCISQGDTIEEAVDNIREAFIGAIETYKELNQEIPWGDVEYSEPIEVRVELLVSVDG